MDEQMTKAAILPDNHENVVAGIVGAFLFSLSGGLIWFLLWQVNVIAGLSGLIGVIAAIKGYAVFGKKESTKGVIISTIIAVLVIVIAWYLCMAKDLYDVLTEEFGSDDITFRWCVINAYDVVVEVDALADYLKDLLFGLAFCAVGAFSSVRLALRRAKVADVPDLDVSQPGFSASDFSAESPAEEQPAVQESPVEQENSAEQDELPH